MTLCPGGTAERRRSVSEVRRLVSGASCPERGFRMVDEATHVPPRMDRTRADGHGSVRRSKVQILLLVLSIEKFFQHMFVTYAFAVDMGDIRDSVVIHHVPLMIVGFIVGVLFLFLPDSSSRTSEPAMCSFPPWRCSTSLPSSSLKAPLPSRSSCRSSSRRSSSSFSSATERRCSTPDRAEANPAARLNPSAWSLLSVIWPSPGDFGSGVKVGGRPGRERW